MVPRMSAVQRPLWDSPVSFKRPPKNEAARSSTPYRISSSRKETKLPLKPTLHPAKRSDAANRLHEADLILALREEKEYKLGGCISFREYLRRHGRVVKDGHVVS